MSFFKVGINKAEIDDIFRDLVDDCDEAIRPAAQAGAQVMYDQVKRNVARIKKVSGNLDKSIYQVYSKDNSGPKRATYHVSWNAKKAPHGHLVEFGHLQKYQVRQKADGTWVTMVRPEKIGTPKPGRNASEAAKDAYYMPRKNGPIQVAAQPFIRSAYESHSEKAMDAMSDRFYEELGKRYGA